MATAPYTHDRTARAHPIPLTATAEHGEFLLFHASSSSTRRGVSSSCVNAQLVAAGDVAIEEASSAAQRIPLGMVSLSRPEELDGVHGSSRRRDPEHSKRQTRWAACSRLWGALQPCGGGPVLGVKLAGPSLTEPVQMMRVESTGSRLSSERCKSSARSSGKPSRSITLYAIVSREVLSCNRRNGSGRRMRRAEEGGHAGGAIRVVARWVQRAAS